MAHLCTWTDRQLQHIILKFVRKSENAAITQTLEWDNEDVAKSIAQSTLDRKYPVKWCLMGTSKEKVYNMFNGKFVHWADEQMIDFIISFSTLCRSLKILLVCRFNEAMRMLHSIEK